MIYYILVFMCIGKESVLFIAHVYKMLLKKLLIFWKKLVFTLSLWLCARIAFENLKLKV